MTLFISYTLSIHKDTQYSSFFNALDSPKVRLDKIFIKMSIDLTALVIYCNNF